MQGPRESVLDRTLAAISDVIFLVDARTRVIETCNKAIERVFGYRVEEVIGKNTEFLHVDAESYARFGGDIFPALDADGIFHTQFKMRRRDGTVFISEHTATEIRGENGERTGVVSVVRDISESHYAVARRREAEFLLRAVLNAAPLSLFATDEHGVFTLHEGKALERLGMEPGHNVGESSLELFGGLPIMEYPDRNTEGESVIKRVLAGETVRGETRLGEVVFDNQFAPLLDEHGKVKGLVGVAFDITERKQIENELIRSQKDLRTMAIKLSNIEETERAHIARDLHDSIGQALSVVGLELALARHEIPDDAPPSVVARMDDMAHQLEDITRSLRTVIAELRPPMLDQYGLVATLRWMAELYTQRTGLESEVSGEPLKPQLPSATATNMIRIAQEALNNVAKHAQASKVYISVAEHQGVVTMIVADDGVGFEQTSVHSGSGSWGIAIMNERAINIGADMSITSSPGAGTSVKVTWTHPPAPRQDQEL